MQCDRCRACLPCGDRDGRHDMPDVTEQRRGLSGTAVGKRARPFPTHVAGPVQYGPRMYGPGDLAIAKHLPVDRLRVLLQLHGVCPPARSRTSGEGAPGPPAAPRPALPVACMDETGLRLAEGTTWLHVLCDMTLYRYAGIAVHDRFAAYCRGSGPMPSANLLRNLQEIVELEEAPHGWAARLQRLLHEARRCARGFRMVTGGPVAPRRRQRLAEAWEDPAAGPGPLRTLAPAPQGEATRPQPGPCAGTGRPACAS